MALFGLIGKTLRHSFSQNYFENKFKTLNLKNHSYKLFELESISEITRVFELKPTGLNVTIPYKEAIIPFLYRLDDSAKKVGAVNVIAREANQYIGYNSDYYGFKSSLQDWLKSNDIQALVLGSGGASKAVIAALKDLNIGHLVVSRNPELHQIGYQDINAELLAQYHLVINTTPLGMYPNIDNYPKLPYEQLSSSHYLYDLVYNPEQTQFLKKGNLYGANTKNGIEMLHLQAEKSWEIWSKIL